MWYRCMMYQIYTAHSILLLLHEEVTAELQSEVDSVVNALHCCSLLITLQEITARVLLITSQIDA